MKNEPKKNASNIIPSLIIVGVLAAVVGGAWYLYRESQASVNANLSNTNRAGANTNTPRANVNAPAGATPPNMLGSPTATVTVEEFADFQCGACASTHPMMKEIQSTYGSRIKFVFRQFPLSIHDKAYDAAVATEAAGLQGKFWQMQDQLFSNQQTWASPSADHKQLWTEYAQKIGLDVQKWQDDMTGISAKSRVDQDMQRGRGLNVASTPSIYINGELVPPPALNVAGMRRIIDAELQKAPASQSQSAPASAAPANSGTAGANANK